MKATTTLEPINRILRMLRIAEDIKACDLAILIGLSPTYISDIEKGRKRPTLNVLEKYGQYFGISPANLLLLQEGNQQASNTELLFRVLEKKLESMEARETVAEVANLNARHALQANSKKRSVKTEKQRELAVAV